MEKALAKRIKALLDDRGIKYAHLGRKIGLDDGQISRMLSGNKRICTGDIPEICRVIGVSPNELFDINEP